MMEIIIDKNTNLKKEKLIIKSLEIAIKKDKDSNDLKSLKYHTMALKEHKNKIKDMLEKEL